MAQISQIFLFYTYIGFFEFFTSKPICNPIFISAVLLKVPYISNRPMHQLYHLKRAITLQNIKIVISHGLINILRIVISVRGKQFFQLRPNWHKLKSVIMETVITCNVSDMRTLLFWDYY